MLKILKSFRQYLIIGIAAVIVIASLMLVYFNVIAADTEGTCGDNLTWSYDADTTTLTITGFGEMTGWSKTKAPWYSYRSEITTVVFDCTDEETGIQLGKYAFSACSVLTDIDMSSVTGIGNYTFYNCSALTDLDISNVTAIDDYAFYGCISLEEITVPESITAVSEGMFQGCTSLKKVTFLGTVTTISNIAFYNCTSLTTIVWSENDASTGVTIPASVAKVGTQAFYCCTSLESVVFEGTSVSFTAASKKKYGQFYGCTSLTSITLPSEQTTIPAYFLEECTSLAQIEIPSTVTTISKYAFYNTGLTSVTIPASVASMGERVFSNCTNLVTVSFEEGSTLEAIPTYLFEACSALTEIVLPDSVTTIGAYAFKDCSSLTSLTFGTGLEEIEICALYGCSNTDLELHFTGEYSDSLDIDDDAFSGITATAYYPADSETWPTSAPVEQNLQFGATQLTWASEGEEVEVSTWWAVSEDETTLYIFLDGAMVNYTAGRAPWYSYRSTITEIVFGVNPDAEEGDDTTYEITAIGNYAFYNFTALEEVTIPASVTSIGNYAFYGCITVEYVYTGSGNQGVNSPVAISGLSTVTFEDGSVLESIGDYAFASCSFLSDITLPSSTSAIGDYAFAECGIEASDYIISYVLGSEDVTDAMVPISETTRILYDTESVGDKWQESVSGVVIDGAELTEGTDYSVSSEAAYVSNTETVVFSTEYLESLEVGTHTGIVELGEYYCRIILCVCASGTTDEEIEAIIEAEIAYSGLEYIDLSYVVDIGEGAFYKNAALKSVTLGEALTEIGTKAFYCCERLEKIEFPGSVSSIGTYAFAQTGLESVVLPADAAVGNYAFAYCYSLTDIAFESDEDEDTITLGAYVFADCTALKTALLTDEVTNVPEGTFYDCTALETVSFEGSISAIGEYAFYGCTSLTALGDLTEAGSIGSYAFYNCQLLTAEGLVLSEELTSDNVGDFVFYNCIGLADENGFIVVNGVLYSYAYSVLSGVDVIQDSSTTINGSGDSTSVYIGTADVPETVTEIADYAFYQLYPASGSITVVWLNGLRFNVPADSVTLGEYSLAGLYATTYIYYSCAYAEGWEAALEAVGYTGSGSSFGDYRYAVSWSVAGVTEHSLSDEPEWNWAEDYSSAEAVFVCSDCGEEVVYEAEVTSQKTATCTEGITYYTATITDTSGNTYTSELTIYTDPAGHQYSDIVTWEWSEDYTSASASITCTVCGNVVSDDAEVTVSEETDGRTCVTAAVTLEEEEYTETIWFTSNAADLTLSAEEHEMSKMVTSTVYALLNESFTTEDGETYELTGWTGEITAESSDETVVTVETDGLAIIITGVSEGTATITVYAVSGETTVVVGTIEVTSITVDCEGNHTWDEGVVTKEATCTEKGMITYTCTVCGENDYETIAATGHSYVLTETSEATCTEDGYEIWVCTVCGYVDTEPTQSAFGHTYVLTASSEATCDAEGYETYTCSTCGDSYTNILEKTSHSFERTYQEPTCTEAGVYTYTCTICGYSYTITGEAALGHAWDPGVVTTEATETTDGIITYTCTECGETLTEVIPATGSTAAIDSEDEEDAEDADSEDEEDDTDADADSEDEEDNTDADADLEDDEEDESVIYTYDVTGNAEYVLASGDSSAAVITVNAPADEFVSVIINGQTLDYGIAYTVDGDGESTVITFTEELLESLGAGEYEVVISFEETDVTAALVISEAEEETEAEAEVTAETETEEETEAESVTYEITDDAEYVISSGEVSAAVITVGAPVDELISVMIDGQTLNPETAYTVDGDEESTVITFTEEFLESLEAGEYEVTVCFEEADVTTILTISEAQEESAASGSSDESESPQTSDENNMLLWIVIFAAAIVVLYTVTAVYGKRKKVNR